MAYMGQEKKAAIAPIIKALCKQYGVKATLAVRHHSTLVLNISAGAIDFIGNHNTKLEQLKSTGYITHHTPAKGYLDVNQYHTDKSFDGEALEFLDAAIAAMNEGNWDKSDIQSDYFNVGWYIDVNVGKWNKSYEFLGAAEQVAA